MENSTPDHQDIGPCREFRHIHSELFSRAVMLLNQYFPSDVINRKVKPFRTGSGQFNIQQLTMEHRVRIDSYTRRIQVFINSNIFSSCNKPDNRRAHRTRYDFRRS